MYGKGFKLEKALQAIEWRTEYLAKELPLKLQPKVFELLQGGWMYIMGRDKNLRPICVLRPPVAYNLKSGVPDP